MLDVSKCKHEESFLDADCGCKVHYFIYPKELGMSEIEFYDESEYGNVVSTCVSVTEEDNGNAYIQMSPTVEDSDCLSDVDWRDLFPEENYDDTTIASLLKMAKDKICICCDCQYLGDKFSFPLPNNMIDTDESNPAIKHYYCCCGDSKQYEKDVSTQSIHKCDCFEEL